MNLPLFLPPFWIWVAAVGVPAIFGLGRYAFFSEGEDPDKNKLGVLGMKKAGKTKFLSFLRNVPYVEKDTEIEPYKPFKYTHETKVIHIDAGVDIGGGNLYRSEYNRIIEKSDVVFYFFDISKYLKNSPYETVGYRRACNSRLEHIYTTGKEIKKHIVVVGTHIDKCKKREAKIKSEFLKLNDSKSYYSVLKNIEFTDLTDTSLLRSFINKVFN